MDMDGKKLKSKVVIAIIGLFLFSFLVNGATSSTTEVSISNVTAQPHEIKIIPIIINNAYGLLNATIELWFNPAIVNVLSIGNSDFNTVLNSDINNGTGKALLNVSNSTGISGNNIIFANVTFNITGNPEESSFLNLINITLRNSSNVDYITVNGTFSVIGYNVSGYVQNNTGGLLSGVEVKNDTYSNITNAGGYYIITNLSNGTYNFSYNKTGFDIGYSEITISGGDITNANKTIIDTTAPLNVTGLINVSYAPNYINWTWTDPVDGDLANISIWINNTFMGNVTPGVQYYNATGFAPSTANTISTKTIDTSGNVNNTWTNHTATTAPAMAPDNIDPVIHNVTFNTSINPGPIILVTVNASDNIAVTNITANDTELIYQVGTIWNGTITTFSTNGTHFVNVSARDAAGNIVWNNLTSYVIDILNPTINITFPANGASTTASSITVTGYVNGTGSTPSVKVNNITATIINDTYSVSVPLSIGSNTITATVTDAAGNTNTSSITVSRTTSGGSSGGSSGGGGGGGGTGEKSYNIECYENDRQYVYEDILTSFVYSYGCNIVDNLDFTGMAKLGKILTKVEMLYNTSTLVELAPPGEIYKNFNIWTGFLGWFSTDHVSDPTLTFTVNKSWVRNNNINPSSISLYFYNANKWDKINIQKINEDSTKYYFRANLPITGSLGSMAVSGQFNSPITPIFTPKPTLIPTLTPTPTPEIIPTPPPMTWTGIWSESIPGFQIIVALSVILLLFVIGRRRG
jgi:PGF-pre-PGF domain-containing protein